MRIFYLGTDPPVCSQIDKLKPLPLINRGNEVPPSSTTFPSCESLVQWNGSQALEQVRVN
eukprot:m.173781 g.173781  ORF g.173781 m.173781 type:complete len:60 (+) comp53277_c0_seq15:89-268(+)